MGGWQHFAHGADIGVRGTGRSQAEAFANAAVALTAVVTDPEAVRPVETIHVECAVTDPELLLCEWLNAIVFEMATRHMLFSRYDVRIDGARLRAELCGERVDITRHAPAVEVKGATLTELSVRRGEDGEWSAQCVLDV